MSKLELEIEGMSCGHCVAAVSEALGELHGVSVENVRIGSARGELPARAGFARADRPGGRGRWLHCPGQVVSYRGPV